MSNYGNLSPLLGTLSIAFVLGFVLLIILFYAYNAFVLAKTFKKAGKPAWAAIIPVYNKLVLLDIIGYKWYYVFIYYLPFVTIIPIIGKIIPLVTFLFNGTSSVKLSKSYGQSTGFGIGLWLVPIVFLSIIAFNKDIKYVGTSVNGDIDFNDLF